MWFATDFTWKLVNLDTATAAGDAVQFEHITSRRYAAPEIRRAVEQRSKQTRLECSSDMWAVGLVAFEIFTGRYRLRHPSSEGAKCRRHGSRFCRSAETRRPPARRVDQARGAHSRRKGDGQRVGPDARAPNPRAPARGGAAEESSQGPSDGHAGAGRTTPSVPSLEWRPSSGHAQKRATAFSPMPMCTFACSSSKAAECSTEATMRWRNGWSAT